MISRNEELKEHITLIITHIKMSMDHLDMINGEIDHVLWIQSDEALNAIQCDFINLLKSLEKKKGGIEL